MLNPNLNIQHLRARFDRDRWLVIENFLDRDIAAGILPSIEECSGEFLLRARNGVYPKTLTFTAPLSTRKHLVLRKQLEVARESNLFTYLFYLFEAHPACGRHAVCAATAYLQSESCLEFIRAVTGEPIVRGEAPGVTRFHQGHYIGPHSDQLAKFGGLRRKVASVLYFCRSWRSGMGGLLTLSTQAGEIALCPGYNQMLLMDVDAFVKHRVTEVQDEHAVRTCMPGFFSVGL